MLSLLLALACAAAPPPAPSSEPSMPVDAATAPLDPAALRFADPDTEQRYRAVRAHLASRHADWRHLPLKAVGNFLQERWCSPVVPERDCQVGLAADGVEPGRAWAELAVLHYTQEFPQAFGLVLSTGSMPTEGPWGARLVLSLGGRGVTGSLLQVDLLHRGEGEPVVIHLGGTRSWEVQETRFSVPGPGGLPGAAPDAEHLAELQALAASAEALQSRAEASLAALQAEVLRGLAAGEARRCEYGAYQGDGIPPECTEVPLDPEQVAAEEARVRQVLGHQRALLQADPEGAWRALLEVVPAGLWSP